MKMISFYNPRENGNSMNTDLFPPSQISIWDETLFMKLCLHLKRSFKNNAFPISDKNIRGGVWEGEDNESSYSLLSGKGWGGVVISRNISSVQKAPFSLI